MVFDAGLVMTHEFEFIGDVVEEFIDMGDAEVDGVAEIVELFVCHGFWGGLSW